MLSPLLSSNTWMLSRVSWCVWWGSAFACEQSKLGGFSCSLPLKLIQYHLDPLSRLAMAGSLSFYFPSAVAVCGARSHPLVPPNPPPRLVKFTYLSNFPELSCFSVILSWGWCVCGCKGAVVASVIWGEHLSLSSSHACEQVHISALSAGATPKQTWHSYIIYELINRD